ncbi:hypothetical protein DUI87_11157 [Hirundo rustica rustica]|uniref:Uncharacterized protein n=1 Tax=Hirundo rustica rustica TaxID=333673 RepID=A0A3M0KLC1_HIRRU|nr:hypothetical protein DUI87_11157 [Hirundo rustica rustica]
MASHYQSQGKIGYWEEVLVYKSGEALAQVVQRSCGCPIPKSVLGQAGQGLEQPGLVEDVPAMAEGLELDAFEDHFLHKPFCDSTTGFHDSSVAAAMLPSQAQQGSRQHPAS